MLTFTCVSIPAPESGTMASYLPPGGSVRLACNGTWRHCQVRARVHLGRDQAPRDGRATRSRRPTAPRRADRVAAFCSPGHDDRAAETEDPTGPSASSAALTGASRRDIGTAVSRL